MPTTKITIDDILSEWEKLGVKSSSEGLTTREIAAKLGCGKATALERIRVLVDSGKMRVEKKRIKGLAGALAWVPVYVPIVTNGKGKR